MLFVVACLQNVDTLCWEMEIAFGCEGSRYLSTRVNRFPIWTAASSLVAGWTPPDEKLAAVLNLLEVMVEPLGRSLTSAAVEEDEISPETAAALERARASLGRGEGVSHEEVLRELSR